MGESVPAHDVVAAVLVEAGRVLLCHRRADLTWYPGVWDLPGGHVEPGESPTEALRRECREELDVDVVDERQAAQVREGDLHLSVFVVSRWDGRPRNAAPEEHDELRWFVAGELDALALADRRYPRLLRDAL
jgi:8-oxo-dGTP pyrophosphatase MutT (NUDIX family)